MCYDRIDIHHKGVMMSQWDRRANAYENDYTRAPIRACIADEIVEEVRNAQPSSILDAGGGQGHLGLRMKLVCPSARLTIIDSSSLMLASARQRLASHGKVEFIHAELDNLSQIENASVDFFTSTFAFHHIDDLRKLRALKEAHRVLKPNGRLLIADEIICDPQLIGDDDATLLAMGEVFYPDLDAQELRRKFDGFVEYPTDLTTMAKMALDAGFASTIRVVNRMVAVLDATRG